MKDNRLGVLLGSFDDKDWKAYQKFAKSRYSEASDHKLIIDYIKKHKNRFNNHNLDSEYLRKKIRPAAKPIVFSNVISKLCKHIEAYFVWAEIHNDPMMEDTLLLKAFANRGLTDQFHNRKKIASTRRQKMPMGLWKHYHEFIISYLDYYKRLTSGVLDSKKVLHNCNQALTNFSNDLNGYLGVEMHNREQVLGETWISEFKHLHKTKELEIDSLDLLFHHYKKMKEKREWKTFHILKRFLFEEDLSKELEYTTITYLTSFLNYKALNNERGENANFELINLIKYGIKNKIMFSNRNIPLNTYSTIIRIGSQAGEFEWSENFILNYAHFVSDKNTEQIRSFGYAYLAYYRENYNETIEILRVKKFNDFILELKAKWLLLVSLYELDPNDIDSYKYYTDSIKYYINRNKGKSTLNGHKAFSNSIYFLNRLIIGKNLSSLKIEIENEKTMVKKKWFLDKIVGLQSKNHSPNFN